MNGDELRKIVEEEVRRAIGGAESQSAQDPSPGAPVEPSPPEPVARWLQDREPRPFRTSARRSKKPAPAPQGKARPSRIARPANPEKLERLLAATPSRIGVGRSGTRYLTEVYVQLRAEHAIAKDAVYSEAKDELVQKLGCLPLRTECKDRQEFLLHPGRGRRLDEASRALLQKDGTRGADVQLIVGDGLSAWASEANGPELLPALQRDLAAAGFSLGRPLFVRFARVGVQDHIGVLLGARATMILLGERPGLGTGDSLSIYIAYGPKLDQDNADKNCISNVRSPGLRPAEAAREATQILKRAFAAGRGGVQLP